MPSEDSLTPHELAEGTLYYKLLLCLKEQTYTSLYPFCQLLMSVDREMHIFKSLTGIKNHTCAVCNKGFSGFLKQGLKCVGQC